MIDRAVPAAFRGAVGTGRSRAGQIDAPPRETPLAPPLCARHQLGHASTPAVNVVNMARKSTASLPPGSTSLKLSGNLGFVPLGNRTELLQRVSCFPPGDPCPMSPARRWRSCTAASAGPGQGLPREGLRLVSAFSPMGN